ncbi:MAG: DUF4439 domain-containing protein [Candidatus Nanopelagicales bacterium]|nr:DUF4439 domain-containing protein [Candidatus Nanopelagicales bacterium]
MRRAGALVRVHRGVGVFARARASGHSLGGEPVVTYTQPDAIAAIARAIQTEQNYVFAAGLAGAFLRGAGRRRATNQVAEHRARLQANAALVDPAEVPATPPGFTSESPITDPKTARSALAALSNALVGVYADVASVTEGADRATAIAWAQASARDAVRWGAASQAFPT